MSDDSTERGMQGVFGKCVCVCVCVCVLLSIVPGDLFPSPIDTVARYSHAQPTLQDIYGHTQESSLTGDTLSHTHTHTHTNIYCLM